ncbi:MAG: hypothetical protein JWM26_1795 [Betaproteobacteria bacterium]|jgi:hypothetical protein|nr:hypothetical protein [Betaproteobacteria bacterium]
MGAGRESDGGEDRLRWLREETAHIPGLPPEGEPRRPLYRVGSLVEHA